MDVQVREEGQPFRFRAIEIVVALGDIQMDSIEGHKIHNLIRITRLDKADGVMT